MSDPRSPHLNSATPWGGPDPRQGPQEPHPEQPGSRAHPQTPYAEQQYPEQYTGRHTGPETAQYPAVNGQHPPVDGQHRGPADAARRPDRRSARRRPPGKPLPEPPAGLAVGAIVAACCLLFVELAELAILLVTGDRGAAAGIGLSPRFDPNSDTVTILFGLAAYVATCLWLQAGRRFTEVADPTARFAHRPVWTWLGWWVPVAALWVPFRVVRDLRGATVPDDERRVSLGLWWFFWLVAGLRLVAPSSGEAEVAVRSIAVVALLLAFAHWIRIVREITRAQEQAAGLG